YARAGSTDKTSSLWSDRTRVCIVRSVQLFPRSRASECVARRQGEIGRRRRKEIVEAAIAIIAEHGLPRLSLSAIEERAGMSRGQLTWYFPAKEGILLAVFDRLIEMMHERSKAGEGSPCGPSEAGWRRLEGFLGCMLLDPPEAPEFHA